MTELTTYQQSSMYFIRFMGAILILFGIMFSYRWWTSSAGINPGIIIFIAFGVIGFIGIYLSKRIAGSFGESHPNPDLKNYEWSLFGVFTLLLIGFISSMIGISQDNALIIQISVSLCGLALILLGIWNYRHELVYIYPSAYFSGARIPLPIHFKITGTAAKIIGVFIALIGLGLICAVVFFPL